MGHAWDDHNRIPFGKYAGKKLGDIPAGYLIFIADSENTQATVGIFGYVLKNRERLEAQAKKEKEDYHANKKRAEQGRPPRESAQQQSESSDDDDIPF